MIISAAEIIDKITVDDIKNYIFDALDPNIWLNVKAARR